MLYTSDINLQIKPMNQLSQETSPYLLQHADNPVAWRGWSQQALDLARKENKPILLSIGYSACHWCHVMAHESFEDPETAALMNEWFINIKVDREERPDLDKIYQSAHSLLTERPGGWPLTVFLTPDKQMPIFAGTYFPHVPRYGMPSFKQLLTHVHDIWLHRKDDIEKQSASLHEVFQRLQKTQQSDINLHAMPLDVARRQIEQQFDAREGGFSGAPKFPHPAILQFALQRDTNSDQPDPRLLHCAVFSLQKMASGGIFDHLGGGYCRYSTDEHWMIPHFEKMLYDNGPLLWLDAQSFCVTGDIQLYDAAIETGDWIVRDMQSPEGGYYSALDADSEGEEGKFYVWDRTEIKQLLGDADYPLFAARFGLDRETNFEDHWHLHAYQDYDALNEQYRTNGHTSRDRLRQMREQLFAVRELRIHPGLDNKILTAWNGLMIEGMATAGRLLEREDFIDSAQRAAGFVRNTLWSKGRFCATTKDGNTHLNAYLDDYAFLLSGLLALLQARWSSELYQWAGKIADTLIDQFEDPQGGFYFTSHDHEQLIMRSKNFADDAMPAGNGVAARCLIELGYLAGKNSYLEAAERCLKAGWQSMSEHPISHCSMLIALQEYLKPPEIIILRGTADELVSWKAAGAGQYRPGTMIFAIENQASVTDVLADKSTQPGGCAYICTGSTCQPPIHDLDNYQQYLHNNHSKI
jgi:uncharacterized protein